jgi:hypothetical protein
MALYFVGHRSALKKFHACAGYAEETMGDIFSVRRIAFGTTI